jgi:group I intron endonuclease
MKTGIYKISNSINRRIYIGSAINFRLRKNRHVTSLKNNKHYNAKLQGFVNKYGIDKLNFELIEECNKENLIQIEQYYIDKYKAVKNGFNILPTAGSWLNKKHSKYSRKKISDTKKGKQTKTMLGKKHSEKTKKLISEKAIGRKQSQKTIANRVKKNTGKIRPKSAIETVRKKLSKLSDNEAMQIKILLQKKVKQMDIAKMFNVCQRSISRIHQGISYTHVTITENQINF